MAGDRPEVPRPVQPFLCIREHVQNAGRGHALFQELLEGVEASRIGVAPETLQDRLSLLETQILVFRKTSVRFLCRRFQPALQGDHKSLRLRRNARAFRIGCETLKALLFAYELLSEIAVTVASGNAQIAGLQLSHHLRERAKLEPAPRYMRRLFPEL